MLTRLRFTSRRKNSRKKLRRTLAKYDPSMRLLQCNPSMRSFRATLHAWWSIEDSAILPCYPSMRSLSAIRQWDSSVRSLSATIDSDFQCDPCAIISTGRAVSSTTLNLDQELTISLKPSTVRTSPRTKQRPGASNFMQNHHSNNQHSPRWGEPLRQE
jgi:hypothetical protein